MEIVPGIHRLELYSGKKLVVHQVIIGEGSLLIDAGTPELAREALLPWLTEVLGDPANLDMILITHADVDHYGGLDVLRTACPHAAILAPARDRRWIENPDAIFAERYDAYHAEHGLTYEPSFTQFLHAWHTPPVSFDLGLVGGADVHCGQELLLQVLHVPGHTPGHLMLWEPRMRVAIIGDALNGMTQVDRDGRWTAPPPYTDRDLYLMSIQTLQTLDPALLLTGHYPIIRGREISSFIQASQDIVSVTEAVLTRALQGSTAPLTLAQLIELANQLLGPFDFPPDLQFALEAHLAWLERQDNIRRLHRTAIAAQEL